MKPQSPVMAAHPRAFPISGDLGKVLPGCGWRMTKIYATTRPCTVAGRQAVMFMRFVFRGGLFQNACSRWEGQLHVPGMGQAPSRLIHSMLVSPRELASRCLIASAKRRSTASGKWPSWLVALCLMSLMFLPRTVYVIRAQHVLTCTEGHQGQVSRLRHQSQIWPSTTQAVQETPHMGPDNSDLRTALQSSQQNKREGKWDDDDPLLSRGLAHVESQPWAAAIVDFVSKAAWHRSCIAILLMYVCMLCMYVYIYIYIYVFISFRPCELGAWVVRVSWCRRVVVIQADHTEGWVPWWEGDVELGLLESTGVAAFASWNFKPSEKVSKDSISNCRGRSATFPSVLGSRHLSAIRPGSKRGTNQKRMEPSSLSL